MRINSLRPSFCSPIKDIENNERNYYETELSKLAKPLPMSAIVLAVPTSVSADAVTDWNAIAVQATVTAARPGQTGIIDVCDGPCRHS